MKKLRTKYLFPFFALLCAMLAQAADNSEAQVRSFVYEIEAKISKNIEEQIIQFVGTDNIWVATHLDVSLDSIEAELKSREPKTEKPEKKKYDDLPGLNIASDGAFVRDLTEEKVLIIDSGEAKIDASMVIANAQSIKVTVYHKAQLEKKIERVIRSLIEEKLRSLNVAVEVKFDHRKAQALDKADLQEGQKIRFEQDSFVKSFHAAVVLAFQDFLDKHVLSPLKIGTILLFITGSLVFFGGLYFLSRTLKSISSSLNSLAKAMVENQSSSSPWGKDLMAQDLSLTSKDAEVTGNTTANEENEARSKILEIYENYREVVANFFTDAMEKKNFQDIWCLSQILGEKLLLENDGLTKHPNYKLYNTFLRDNLFNQVSAQDCKKIYQKLMSLMLYPDVFFMNGIRSQIARLTQDKLGSLFQTLNKNERGILAEVVDSFRLATLINTGLVLPEDITDLSVSSPDLATLRKLDIKISQYLDETVREQSKVLSVLTLLNQFQYDAYLMSSKLPEKFHFMNLYELRKDEANEFFKALSADELCSLLPMLSQEMEEAILPLLPEIKLARVEQGAKVLGRQSQVLMQRLFLILWQGNIEDELQKEIKGTEKIKLKAA